MTVALLRFVPYRTQHGACCLIELFPIKLMRKNNANSILRRIDRVDLQVSLMNYSHHMEQELFHRKRSCRAEDSLIRVFVEVHDDDVDRRRTRVGGSGRDTKLAGPWVVVFSVDDGAFIFGIPVNGAELVRHD